MATDQTVSGFGWAVDNVELSNSVLLTSTATALSDQGYSGSAEARTEVTEPGTACGDGIVAGTNQCDDGNTADGDGCSATCQVEQCYVCSGQPSLCSATDGASCNDGLFCNGADTCSGNQCIIHDGDPCAGMAIDQCGGTCNETRNSCFEAAGQACTSDNDPCTLDGCDGAGSCIHTPVTSCSTTTTTITTTTTSTTTTTIVDVCESAVCGDGTVTADCEVCDDGNTTGGDGCSANCLSDETCGNGYVDTLAGEVCDDSNNDNTDTCLNDCTAASCGDGIVNLQQVPNSDYTGTEIPFDWLDVSAQDTELYLNDDDVSSALSLGFDFDFYGNRYSRTYVSSNGFITFDETSDSGCCDGDSLPNSQAPNNLIAAYWTDLNPLSGGRYSYAQLPGVFVVEAKDVPLFFFQSTLLNSFQYQLYENSSRIELHYLSVVEEWDATAGIEDATGSSGEQHYAGQTALSSYAIAYQIDVALEQCDDGNTTGGDGCSASCQIEVSTPQSKPQQRCINALNKSGAKVARIQDKENATCIKDAWKGRIDNPQTCLSQDRRGKLAKARQKTIRMETAKCTETPDLGYVGSAVVNTATVAARTGLLADLLGPNLDTTVSPSSLRGKCQANMAKAMGKVSVAMDKAFLSCKKKGMRSGLIISQNTLGACLDAVTVDTRGRIARAMSRATRVLDNNCAQDDQAASFAGTCAQAADFVTCAGQRGSCRLCSMFKAMDDLATDCDLYDDGLANVSCP
jgi:cysteine-rich repeat protein